MTQELFPYQLNLTRALLWPAGALPWQPFTKQLQYRRKPGLQRRKLQRQDNPHSGTLPLNGRGKFNCCNSLSSLSVLCKGQFFPLFLMQSRTLGRHKWDHSWLSWTFPVSWAYLTPAQSWWGREQSLSSSLSGLLPLISLDKMGMTLEMFCEPSLSLAFNCFLGRHFLCFCFHSLNCCLLVM